MATELTPAATAADQIRVGLSDPLGQIPADYWINVDPADTPAGLEAHLIGAGILNGRGPGNEVLTYAMACAGRALVRDETLASQGVTDGARITVNTKNIQGGDQVRLHLAPSQC